MSNNGWPQQPEDDLRVDTAWRENYSGASMNQKLHGTLNKGIYSGFKVSPAASGLAVEVAGLGEPNIAVIEVDTFSLTARMPGDVTKQLGVVAGKIQYVVFEVVYAKQQESTINLRVKDAINDDHIVLATLDIPAGVSAVTADMVKQAPIAKSATQSDFAELMAYVVDNSRRQMSMEERLRNVESELNKLKSA